MRRAIGWMIAATIWSGAALHAQSAADRCGNICAQVGMFCILGSMADPGPSANPAYVRECRACEKLLCGGGGPTTPAPPADKPKIELPKLLTPCGTRTDQASVNVTWTPGKRMTYHRLKVGTEAGTDGVVVIDAGAATSAGVNNIPIGKTIHVTLESTDDEGQPHYTSCTFTSLGEASVSALMRVYPALYITGASYRSIPQVTPESCSEACRTEANCKSYTYFRPEATQDRTARCELKSTAESYTQNNCCISGMKVPRPQPQQEAAHTPAPPPPARRQGGDMFDEMKSQRNSLAPEPQTMRSGGDYAAIQMRTANPEDCAQFCRAEAECKAYNYTHPGVEGPTAVCRLKRFVTQPVRNGCCVSGVK